MNCNAPSTDVATIENLGCVFQKLVGSLLALAGLVLFVLLIIGGFKYITSGGDPKAVEGAQKTLTYAIGGLILILISYLIILLIQTITGAPVTIFSVVLQ